MSKAYHLTVCFISLLALGCGGSTEPNSQALPTGTYSVFIPISNPNIWTSWRASWPAGTARTDCAFIGGSITITDNGRFTETRLYSGVNPVFSTQATLSGSYHFVSEKSVYAFSVDGGADTVVLAGTVISGVQHEELMMRRFFALRGGCTSGGPLEISYVK
ncbi:MAG: hypothetical protein M3P26_15755 [Gemmatimonadota bacterium]|nr:hypothetical protein [Gemmatimonadota bacterium]